MLIRCKLSPRATRAACPPPFLLPLLPCPRRSHLQTGLVVLPFLPGDSLLFVAGTLAAMPQLHLSIAVLWYVLVVAAIAGDALNYWIGHRMGPAIFRWDGETLPVGTLLSSNR